MSIRAAVFLSVAGVAGLIVLLALLVATCGSSAEDDVDRERLTIVTANDTTARLDVEIADTPEERQQGLMGRTEIPQDTGMLFVFDRCCSGFWMRDTPASLSVAFIEDCGRIVYIADMQPFSETIVNSPSPYAFGLEVAQGWFQRNGVTTGDIVSIPREYRKPGC